MSKLDSTITSTLSSTIAGEFHSVTIISLLGSAYLIAMTATQPLSGKLSDILGRRIVFLFACLIFAAGNLTCSVAQSVPAMVLGRMLAGCGGGACNSISTFVTSDYVPLRSRGLWQGFGLILYVSGCGLGGVMGGAMNDTVGWRLAFVPLVPSSIIAGIALMFILPSNTSQEMSLRQQLKRVDFAGAFTLVASLALLLVGLDVTGSSPGKTLPAILIPLSAIFMAAFALIEGWYAKEPVVPPRLLLNRTLLATCLAALFSSMMFYTLLYYVPLYLQLKGANTSETGLWLLAEPIGGGTGTMLAGIFTRVTGRYGTLNIVAPALMISGCIGFFMANLETAFSLASTFLLFSGLGFGGRQTVLLLGLLSSVDHSEHAPATSIMYAFRGSGATIGLSVASLIFRHGLTSPDIEDTLRCQPQGNDECYRSKLDYMLALRRVFLLGLVFSVCSFVCGLFMRNNSLPTQLKGRQTTDTQSREDQAETQEN